MKNLINLINYTDDRLWSYDHNLICTCSNEQAKIDYLNAFGVELVPGVSVLEGVPEPIRTEWKQVYLRGLQGKKISFIHSFGLEELPAYLKITLVPILEKDEVVGVACTSHDITELKIVERQMLQNEAYLTAQIENTKDAIWSVDRDYKLLIVNTAMIHGYMAAYGRQLKVGENMIESAPEEMREVWIERYERALKGEVFSVLEEFNFGEQTQYIELSLNPIRVKNAVVGVACFGKDITPVKSSEIALQKSVELKDRFFSIIAHDLKGPVGNIRELVKMLASTSLKLSQDQQNEIVSHLSNATHGVYELLDNLLAWAMSQQNFVKVKKERLNVNKLIEDSIKAYRTSAESKNITTTIKVDHQTEVFADKRALSSTIANLYNNAIKFTNESGTITLSAKNLVQHLEFCVSDTGVGMDEEVLSSLFDETKVLTKAGTRKERGTGLGLLLCKEFVMLNGGELWVKSKLGEGSAFCFTVPLVEVNI
ncbi:ATP-binding protein [Reichenbachiella agarivorans]|uniref:histidine kinase n=1 Tax=Reichenbachiella agarivorans TaxID=2979464 RepID=A0ABY6CKD5_9BACT|nr:ATP-binding protein [Reichenbachiella agarivorans]UXP30982.1 ATP-binding protein [Reichenbachiella agarivorans]